MKYNFNDKSLLLSYIQQYISETYNDSIKVNGSYYNTFDMNYGMAHFIAKYLDYRYPMPDKNLKLNYFSTDNIQRSINEPITLMNYFLCDNSGNKLEFNPIDDTATSEIITDTNYINNNYILHNPIYSKIYNSLMIVVNTSDIPTNPVYKPRDKMYFNYYDTPLFISYDSNTDKYTVDNNIIFRLSKWGTEKQICEIDDFVGSYLLGRTIGPKSSMEDIYYVQKLLIRNRNIQDFEKGIWCPVGYENTIHDMTQTVMNYQRLLVSSNNKYNVFVTGYFDIFTEAVAIKEIGVRTNGILGL